MEEYVSKNGVEKKEGVDELLAYLKENNYKTAVATASDIGRTQRFLGMTEIFEMFDEIVCGPEVAHGKPQPDIYIAAAKKLGLKPEECIGLEDSSNGILAAYRAGVAPVMVPDLDEPDDETKKLLYAKAKSLKDVIPLLC